MINSNQILIKDKSGRIRPVNLDMQAKSVPSAPRVPAPVATSEKKETETEEPKSNLIAKEMAMPAFYFDREDEEEAAQYKNQDKLKARAKKQVIIEYALDDILKKSALIIDKGAEDRLRRIVESRLRDIRDLIETKDALIKPRVSGGTGLNEEQTKRVLKNIEAYRIKIYEGKDTEEEMILANSPQPKITDLHLSPRPRNNGQTFDIIKKESSTLKELPDLRNVKQVFDVKAPVSPIVAQSRLKSVADLRDIATSHDNFKNLYQPKSNVFIQQERNRPIYGPVEELAHLSLDDLRSLGKNLSDAFVKIKHKIEMLQDESYEKRTLGLQAWRQSPVYQNYLMIGQRSVEKGLDVSQVIQQKQAANEQCLTLEEFMSIADFNEELSY